MRREVHREMVIPANYYNAAGAPALPVNVRLTTKAELINLGDRERHGFASTESVEPKIIFMRSEVEPLEGAMVSFQIDEVYRLLATEPPDDLTVTVLCVRLSDTQAAVFPPPASAVSPVLLP